jgi:FtsZ-interacting cell division protein ZipA
MDQARMFIYLLGAVVLLFFLAFGFRKSSRSSLLAADSESLEASVSSASMLDAPPTETTEVAPGLGFEVVSSKEKAINDFIAKMGREAAIYESDPMSGQDLQSKIGQKEWSHMVHETFQHRTHAQEKTSYDYYDENLIVMNIMAPSGFVFSGSDILQALTCQGFSYAVPGVFQRHNAEQQVQFKAVSAVGNGFFPPRHLDQFETPGISLFMELDKLENPRAAFRQMLTDAHELNYALGGSLKDAAGDNLSQQSVAHYLASIKLVEESLRAEMHA